MKTHEELCGMTTKQLKEYAKEIGCSLGYDAARKDTTINAIEAQRYGRRCVMIPPTPWQWQFPSCEKRVPRDDYERDRQTQAIHKGAVRAHIAFGRRDDDGMLPYAMELMDVIHACETALREFEPLQLDRVKALVIRKNDDRGYYDGRA